MQDQTLSNNAGKSHRFRTLLTLGAGISMCSAVLFLGSGCESDAQTGALLGAGIGALAGQAIGRDTTGTLIGTAVGAGAGYAVGNESDKNKERNRHNNDW